MPNQALIIVDMQNDFMPDGALPVEGGYDIVEPINELMEQFELVVATQDWHPPDHCSFASNHEGKEPGETVEVEGIEQILWPDHCVQETEGADFVDGLNVDGVDKIFQNGDDPRYDSYSGFWDNAHKKSTGMGEFLREQGVSHIFVVGVATDYCVKYTAIDGCREEFETHVVLDACRGVENQPGDIEEAVVDMVAAGAKMTSIEEMLS